MLTVKEFKKHLDTYQNITLTLMNAGNSTFSIGYPDVIKHVGSKLKLRWNIDQNDYPEPFTYAVLHKDKEILLAREISPVDISNSKSLQLSFDY